MPDGIVAAACIIDVSLIMRRAADLPVTPAFTRTLRVNSRH